MFDIPPPTVPLRDDNRPILCQMAIELSLQELVNAAIKAGWNETEVLGAVIEVADNLMLAHGANAELAAMLKALKRGLD